MQKQVIIVDDEKEVADAMKIALEFNGYEVTVFSSHAQAHAYLNVWTPMPAIFILDADGQIESLIQSIQDRCTSGSVDCAILYSSYMSPGMKEREMISNFKINFLRKPVLPNELIQRIEDLI